MNIFITKRDGSKELFNADKINRSIERACDGLSDPIGFVVQVATDTRLMLYDGITTEEMDRATIDAAVQNIKNDIEYEVILVDATETPIERPKKNSGNSTQERKKDIP